MSPNIIRYLRLIGLFLLLGKIAPAQITGSDKICIGTTYTYQTTATGLSPSWSVYGGHFIGVSTGRTVKVQWDAPSGGLSLTTRVPKSEDLYEYSMGVQAFAGGTVNGPTNYCGSASGSLTLSGQVGAILRWEYSTDGNNWTPLSNTTATHSFSGITQNTMFRAVIAAGACGTLYSSTATINILPLPAAVAITPGSRCGTGTVTLSADGSGTSYRWYSDNGTRLSESSTRSFVTPSLTASTAFWVSTVSAQGCESPRKTIIATINTLPPAAPAPSVDAQCGSSTLTAAAPPAGIGYYWQTTPDAFSTDNAWPSFTTNTSGTYYQRARNNSTGCWSVPTSSFVAINTIPAAPAVPTASDDCKKVTFTAAAQQGGSYFWQTNATGTSTSNAGSIYTVTASGTYYLRTRVDATGCWSPATAFTADVKPRLNCLEGQPVNFVVTNTMLKEGVKTEEAINSLLAEDNHQQVSYTDGFGRPIQQVAVQQSPTKQDVVIMTTYDRKGRPSKTYLPYTAALDGRYDAAAAASLSSFYTASSDRATTTKPWAEDVFEASPLERIREQGAAGESWQPGANSIKNFYRPNNANEVRLWNYDFTTGQCSATAYYAPGELMVTQVTDEQGYKKWDYADKQGHVVLTRREVSGTESVYTYYVFDAMSRLRMVIQPQGVQELTASGNWNPDASFVSKWCFTYRYDRLGRVAEKKVPGADAVYYVYNRRNQPILSQDGEQRRRSEWTFTRYDGLGRTIMSGTYVQTPALGQEAMQQAADAFGGTSESRTATKFDTQYGYTTGQSFPVLTTSNSQVNAVYYFDDYNFDFNESTADATYSTGSMNATPEPTYQVKNLATGARKRVLGTNQMLLSAIFYDRQGRVIQTQAQNYMGGNDVVTNRYDFAGRLLESKEQQTTGAESVAVGKQLTYDHAGRPLTLKHQVNNGPVVILSSARYNELGQRVEKKLHSTDGISYLQKVDYRYNIRGWLTKINDAALSESSDLFGLELLYNEGPVSQAGTSYNNGLVSEMLCNDRLDNQQKAYAFTYDGLGRLNAARFAARGVGGWTEQLGGFNEDGISYDLNGNLLALQRYAQPLGQTNRQKTDYLVYSYDGNRLVNTDNDPARGSFAFASLNSLLPQYAYDANGNLSADSNHDMDSIRYNYLNLPAELYKKDGTHVTYTYDAGGLRLSKIVNNISRNYINGFEYGSSGQLEWFATDEGRVVKTATGFSYEYFLKDHLGNVRVSFDQDATGRARIIQRNSYYPFGHVQPGSSFVSGQPNKYLFSGKEVQDEWGVYDYGARMYDPWLGRWNGLDPLAEKTYSSSPYTYALNNPVIATDPDGKEAIVVSGGEYGTSRYKYNFIEPAIRQLKLLKEDGHDPNITWLVTTAGYSDGQMAAFARVAKDLDVNFLPMNSAADLTSYINGKDMLVDYFKVPDARAADQVTSLDIFSHGGPSVVSFAYGQGDDKKHFNWYIDDARQLLPEAFNSAVLNFYSCNAANSTANGPGLLEVVNQTTGAAVTGYQGRTDYTDINKWQGPVDWLNRKFNGFNTNGSVSAPGPGFDSHRVELPPPPEKKKDDPTVAPPL